MKKVILTLLILFRIGQIGNAQSLDNSIYKYIGNDKTKIVALKGNNYKTIYQEDLFGLLYDIENSKYLTPFSIAFMFSQSTEICKGISLNFQYSQLNDVINYMDKTFEPKDPPNGAKVSFFKAWMEYENGIRYVWKLQKTDNIFFLTLAAR